MSEKILTRNEMKNIAIKALRALELDPDAIGDFVDYSEVQCYSNSGIISTESPTEEGKKLKEMIENHEKEYGDLVYAVIKSDTFMGIMYSMLIVSSYAEDNRDILSLIYDGYAFAWVENETIPEYSEYGHIGIYSGNGTLERTA